MRDQHDLFASEPGLPEGFRYGEGVISAENHARLIDQVQNLAFENFKFHGYEGRRRVVSYGWRYDFARAKLEAAEDMPLFLLELRRTIAGFASVPAPHFQQVLVTEYGAGAAIGWHRDKSVFGEVVGVSLLSPCVFRLRRKSGDKWERASIIAQPRSAYLLAGPARTEWEHSIPPVESLRYSITFRNLRA